MARRHTPEQIIRKLREAERLAGEGATTAEAAKQIWTAPGPWSGSYESVGCGCSAANAVGAGIPSAEWGR
jgi:hypothetical protein